jgi:hypothetical protein
MATLREGAPDFPVEHGKLVRLPGTIGRFQFRLHAAVSASTSRVEAFSARHLQSRCSPIPDKTRPLAPRWL